MIWLILGLVVFLIIFLLSLCKAAGDADRRAEEMYWEEVGRRRGY